MAEDFYTQWLAVPPGDRPPDHYTLLGVRRFCPDLDAVERAVRVQLRRLDEYALHPDRDTRDAVQDMMNEVARARMCLVHPEKRTAYDEGLAKRLGVAAPAAPGPPPLPRRAPRRAPAAPPPLPPEVAARRPRPPAAPAPLVPDEVVRFEELVWQHLRKWKLNAQEERLLLAEAENLGVSSRAARQIIARVDREAEELAAKKQRRWHYALAGLAAAAVAAMVLCVAIPAWMERAREAAYERHVAAARKGIRGGDLKTAAAELAAAAAVLADGQELPALREELGRRSVAAVSDRLAGGEPLAAAQALELAQQVAPSHPDLSVLQKRVWQAVLAAGLAPAPHAATPSPDGVLPPRMTLDLGGGVSMKLVLIPAGTFLMGSPAGEEGRGSDETQHEVTLTKPFYMGVYEVTQEQYGQIVGTNPSRFRGRTKPVEQVSWEDATSFCRKLSAQTHKMARLPTEAQWEYACRAGSTTRYSFGDSDTLLGQYAWYGESSGRQAHEVGRKQPNAWGLYDMHGNVWEWCQDWYEPYRAGEQTDPSGPRSGSGRVVRGGSWYVGAGYSRSASRGCYLPDHRDDSIGFRVVVLLYGGGLP